MENYIKEAEYIEENDKTQINKFSLLPDELLVEIFRYLQDPNTELDPRNRTIRHHCVGYILPLICKRWKRIANDPSLWTRITINKQHFSCNQIFACLKSKPNIRILDLDLRDLDQDWTKSYVKILICVLTLCQNLQCLRIGIKFLSSFPRIPIPSKSIQHIVFQVYRISHEDILNVCQQLPNLTSVQFSENISIDIPISLNHIANSLNGLKVLTIGSQTKRHEDGSVRNLLNKQKNSLMHLCLDNCQSLTDCAFSEIENCTNLAKLRLDGTKELTDGFLNLICRLPHLAFLSFSVNHFTANGWNYFLDHRVCSLKAFQLHNLNRGRDIVTNNGFNDDVLAKLSIKSPQLYYLSLDYSPRISDRGVQAIINNCAEMESLFLYRIPQVTAKPFIEIPQLMPKLKCLHVDGYKESLSDEQKAEDKQQLISLGVPIDVKVKLEYPFTNVVCDHFKETRVYSGQFS